MPPTMEHTPVRLTRTSDALPGRGKWSACDGRFVVVHVPARGGNPPAYDVTDTARTDWVDRPGQGNVVRVYELEDARALIAKAIRRTSRRRR